MCKGLAWFVHAFANCPYVIWFTNTTFSVIIRYQVYYDKNSEQRVLETWKFFFKVVWNNAPKVIGETYVHDIRKGRIHNFVFIRFFFLRNPGNYVSVSENTIVIYHDVQVKRSWRKASISKQMKNGIIFRDDMFNQLY